MRKKTNKIILTLLAVMLVISAVPLAGLVGLDLSDITALSFEAKASDYYWYWTLDNGKVRIDGVSDAIEGSLTIPSKIGGYTVTSIRKNAFIYQEGLTSVTIPASVTSIGNSAFKGCISLHTVKFKDGSKLKSIGEHAFASTQIKSITIPAGVTKISEDTFSCCSRLTTVKFQENSKLKEIQDFAFKDCPIESITIPASVTKISGAFELCSKLSKVSFEKDSKLKKIGDWTFGGCKALTSITIPASVETIGASAFADCSSLTKVVFKNANHLRSIHEEAFNSKVTIHGYTGNYEEAYAKDNDIAFVSHGSHEHGYIEKVTKASTCTKKGVLTYSCYCGKTYTKSAPLAEHKYTAKVKTKATTSEKGTMLYTCSVCSKSYTKSIAKIKSVTLSHTSFAYNGNVKQPKVTVKDTNGNKLKKGTDYTVSYSSGRTDIGTYNVKVKFKGNYSGSKTLTFKINPSRVENLTASAESADTIRLSWDEYYYGDHDIYYLIYRYDSGKKEYVKIGKTSNTYYSDGKLSQYKNYGYKVIPVAKYTKNEKTTTYKGKGATVKCRTLLAAPKYEITVYTNSIKIKWQKNSKADGYKIYKFDVYGYDETVLKTVTSNKAGSYTDKKIGKQGFYGYCIVSYKVVNGKKIYGEFSNASYSYDSDAVLRGATKKNRTSFKVYNKQGKKTTSYTHTLSSNEISILKNFAKKHFTSKMSDDDKLYYTLWWINQNVTYATGSNWNKISGKSWVEAIFKMKLGQCAQYNGARLL